MRFSLSPEQRQFATSIDDLLSTMDTASAARAWADGKPEAGLDTWRALAGLGVPALLVPEHWDGLGATAVDLVVAFERLGYHAVPGPYVDTAAVLPVLLRDSGLAERWLPGVASGATLGSVVGDPHVPYALDADLAEVRISLTGDSFVPGGLLSTVDSVRRLFEPMRGKLLASDVDARPAFEFGAMATAAQALGAGQWMLDASVAYAKQRVQYGRPIGSYQAVKHLLADVATAVELARPLLYGAAIALDRASATAARDVSAAKVAASDAAYLAARTGLQVHGAIGYTAEHDLGLRLTKVRALVAAWGTTRFHRTRVLEAVTKAAEGHLQDAGGSEGTLQYAERPKGGLQPLRNGESR